MAEFHDRALYRCSRHSADTDVSPCAIAAPATVRSRIVVEVDRVGDASGPQGGALQVQRLRHPGRLLAPGEFVPPAVVGLPRPLPPAVGRVPGPSGACPA